MINKNENIRAESYCLFVNKVDTKITESDENK